MPEVTRTPVSSYTPSGSTALTVVGAASVHAAVSDSSDSSYVTVPTTAGQLEYGRMRSVVVFAPLNLPANAVIEWIKPVVRSKWWWGNGFLTIRKVTGYNSAGEHSSPAGTKMIGTAPGDYVWRTADGNIFPKASDGASWTSCDPAKFEAEISFGPRYFCDSDFRWAGPVWFAGQIAKVELQVSYRIVPTVSSVVPGGSNITETQPTVFWSIDSSQEAYRVIVVRSDQLDSSNRSPGAVNYDPSTVASPAFDSGNTYSAATSQVVTRHLDHGSTYYAYVRSWAPRVNDIELASAWTTSGAFTVNSLQVAVPTLTLTNDSTYYAVQVNIARGGVPVGWNDPTFYALQRYDDDLAEWVNVPGATRFSGAGPWNYWDSSAKPGVSTQYRVRGVYLTGANKEIASAWATGSTTLTLKSEWWLKDRVDHFLNRKITVASHEASIPKPSEVAYGAGAKGATVTHQGVRRDSHRIKVWCQTAAEYDDLRALIDTGRTLVLNSVFGDAWQVQVADQATVEIVRAQPVVGETSPIRHLYNVNMTLIEVEQ